MKELPFIFDEDMNGWLSNPFVVDEETVVHIELSCKAPVVTLKQEPDGKYANYGQTPQESDRYEIDITTEQVETIRLATPAEVTRCYIIN